MKEVKENIYTYIMPNYIYVPYEEGTSLKANANKVVNLYTPLGIKDNKFIYSSVSGKVLGRKEMMTYDGLKKTIVIENDFIDKKNKAYGVKKDITKYKKRETIALLELLGLKRNFLNKETLVINTTYDKKDLSDSCLIKNNAFDILETIDLLLNIFELKNAVIMLNNSDNSEHVINKYMGSYPNFNIKNVSKNYSSEELEQKLFKKDSIVIYSILEIYEVFLVLFNNRFLKEKYITISAKEKSIIVKVRIGTSIYELLGALKISYKDLHVSLISNNKIVTTSDAVITKELKSIEVI